MKIVSLRLRRVFLAAFCILLGGHEAGGTTLQFSYSDPTIGLTFKGSFEGTLLEDKNSFAIKGVDSFGYALDPKIYPDAGKQGSGEWSLPNVMGGDYFWFSQLIGKTVGNPFGSLTIDGSYMDFTACTDPKCQEAVFSILAGDEFVNYLSSVDENFKEGAPLLEASILGERPVLFDASYWKAWVLPTDPKADQTASAKAEAAGASGPMPAVAEPSSVALMGLGLLGCLMLARRPRLTPTPD